MKCYLEMWDHTKVEVEIPDGTTEIAGVTISGDEILVYPCYCDPNGYNRVDDYFEGSFCRIWKDGEWVDKEDYETIDVEED